MSNHFINVITGNSGANSSRKQSQCQDRSRKKLPVHYYYPHGFLL
jgi:hypothetical protein